MPDSEQRHSLAVGELQNETAALVRALHHVKRRPPLLGLFARREITLSVAQKDSLILSIKERGDVAAVPYLLPLVLDVSTRSVTLQALGALMQQASNEEIRWLAQGRALQDASYVVSGYAHDSWSALSLADLSAFAEDSPNLVWLHGLFSFHRNGFIREWAARQLAESAHEVALIFLLLRTNDWVPEVRDAAQTAALWCVQRHGVSALAKRLDWVERAGRGRRGGGDFIGVLTGLLVDEDGLGALAQATQSPSRAVRRMAYGLIWQSSDEACHPFLDTALRDGDLPVRLGAAKRHVERADVDAPWKGLLNHRASAVRRVALRALADFSDPAAQGGVHLDAWRPHLLDPSVSNRAFARHFAARSGMTDFAGHYRTELGHRDETKRAVALMGLGETGGQDDAPLVFEYLSSANVRVRRAATAAFGRLAESAQARTQLGARLLDDRASVSHAARAALIKRDLSLPTPILLSLIKSPDAHVRKNALRLMSAAPFWEAGLLLIPAHARIVASERSVVDEHLERWIWRANRSFVKPSSAQSDTLNALLATCQSAHVVVLRELLALWTRPGV